MPESVSILDAPWPRVVFGVGALDRVGDEVALLGCRAVLLIVDVSARAAGDEIERALAAAVADRIDEVAMHVPVPLAQAATGRARAGGIDLLLSVGGGSATGLAKAVALEVSLPILAVPTTYAGSEMTPVWVLTDPGDAATGVVASKRTGRDPRVRPRVVIYDPRVDPVAAAQAVRVQRSECAGAPDDGLFARGTTPVVGAIAEEGVRALADALPRVVAAPADLAARVDALYGAWLAGWTMGAATTGLHHKLCHVIGGSYGLPHADVHAAVLPYSTAFLAPYAPAGRPGLRGRWVVPTRPGPSTTWRV
jgi:maleylacetate reductase